MHEVANDASVKEAIAAVEDAAGLDPNTLDLAAVRGLASDLHGVGRARAVWQILKRRSAWRAAFVVLGVALLAIGIALVFAREWVQSAAAVVVAVLGIVTAAARTIATVIRPASAFATAVDHALEQAREAQATRQAEIAKEESEQRATLLRLEEEAAARRTSLVAADAQQRDAARAITEIEEGRAAARFIAERAASADYERHLGLISMIQRDLAKLSNLMRPPESAEKPAERDESLPQIDRIVLYIDDLDRCPAHLVVEVLQAVHLLLAYPLFVVVVGVDPRWLVSSLSHHHSAMLGSEGVVTVDDDKTANYTAKPQEYLEKIFQLPLILEPMGETGYARLVSELLPLRGAETNGTGTDGDRTPSDETKANGDRATPGAGSGEEEAFDPGHRSLHIESAELELIKQLWPLMPSPRAVKRLSNVYRFVRAQVPPHELPSFTGESGPPGEYPAVLILLAVLIGLPDDAPTVLSIVCDPQHETLKDVLADTSGVPQPGLDRLRQATKGFEDYPLETVRSQLAPSHAVLVLVLGDRISAERTRGAFFPRASTTPQNSPEPFGRVAARASEA